MQLTGRDREIIRLVHRHRFLRSSHIAALMGDSSQQILRRLQLLYHHGYLERPRAQLQFYEHGGSKSIAYGLGDKGGTCLKHELGIAVHHDSWDEKNHVIGRVFLEHALLVADVMVAIELACRKHGIRLLYENQLAFQTERRPFRWKVKINDGQKLGVIPDRVFALEFPDTNGTSQRAHFFLEADRGTMPVVRRNLSQTSFRRKLIAYEATWNQNIHRLRFGFNRFRVLTVTTSPARVNSLVQACSQLKSGHGLFLFADQSILSGDILSARWQTGRPGEVAGLLG
ncbi:MAG TPA: replication-relaxation family protein [Candidatus Limnocylindrales bacterium]|nr:replication-relaxation family protein [Candidatus Limnocylindrales bacterium]